MTDKKNEVIHSIYSLYKEQGFVSEDVLFDTILDSGISLDEVDRVCDTLLSMGVFIQDKEAVGEADEEVIDRAQLDYDEIFCRVIEKVPSLDTFIDEVKTIAPPKTRESSNLMQQAKSGNAFARNRLIEMIIRVAVKMALNFSDRYGVPLDDAVQHALEGLIIAYEKYEIGRQDNFTTYAPWWIRQNLYRTVDFCHGMHVPVHVEEKIMAMIEMYNQHYCDSCNTFNICPEFIHEVEEKLELTEDKAEKYYELLKEQLSVEVLIEDESEKLLQDNFDDIIEHVNNSQRKIAVEAALKALTHKEASVLRLRFGFVDGEEHTLEEVGYIFDVTRERIRQIEAKALRKLRHPSRSKYLRAFI